ncbi:MAG: penicillin-binding protein 2 [Conexibacter sp.]
MIQPSDDRRTPITPQLAMRVAILGGVALTLFGIVFFRLWFLQVLSGDEYVAQARGNRVRDVTIAAPRGEMVDRNGNVLVENRRAVSVLVSPPRLPDEAGERRRLFVRLSRVLGVSAQPRRCRVGDEREQLMRLECLVAQGVFQLPYADVTVDTDVPREVYSYLAERQQQFPGVSIRQVFLRSYPHAQVGAQLFGTIGQVSEAQLHEEHFRGVRAGTLVGKSGLEWTYDRYLRGRDGATRIQVDAFGRAQGYLRRRAPISGNNVKLSLDLDLQRAGQAALREGIGLANANGNPAGAAAFVALDPRDGEILAMGSEPSFDPTILTRPITLRDYRTQLGETAGYPQINRAIGAAYPVGSTFKVITAAAALASGVITPGTPYVDDGTFEQGTLERQNAGGVSYGTVTLPTALSYSVDTFFYYLGQRLNSTRPNGGPLQAWARKFGMGAQTGIDIGGEVAGTIPSPHWRSERWRAEQRCRKREHKPNCYLADDRPWSEGDNSNLAVGQGDFLATPLQMAVAYAAIENGGTIVRPHVGLQIADRDGRVLQEIDPEPARHIEISDLSAIQAGLRAAASAAGGTSADVFAGFPFPVHGKTGTAQVAGKADQSWYVAYVPDPVKPIVVACTVESGGFGAQAAAPAVRLILSQWFGVKKEVVVGESHTR